MGLVFWALLAVISAPSALANAPSNDNIEARLPAMFGSTITGTNVEATPASEELLTLNDPGHQVCTDDGTAGTTGAATSSTVWYSFTGTGGPVTVTTAGSSFDTMLAVYDITTSVTRPSLQICNDDVGLRGIDTRVSSEVEVPTIANRRYAIQVGSCINAPQGCSSATGDFKLGVFRTPSNDLQAMATLVSTFPFSSTNAGATLEGAETGATCNGRPFAKTVWFAWTAPDPGAAVFSTSGQDTVLAVYRPDSSLLGCNDDVVAGQHAGSQVPLSQPVRNVQAGTYLIQVGGAYADGLKPNAAAAGPFSLQVAYTVSNDIDEDGYTTAVDCDDRNSAAHPNAVDIPDNNVDEDCSGSGAVTPPPPTTPTTPVEPPAPAGNGVVPPPGPAGPAGPVPASDRDRDGTPDTLDCNPTNPKIHPGAKEVARNNVDEDCVDGPLYPDMPRRTNIVFKSSHTSPSNGVATISRFEITSPVKRSKVTLRCTARACPFGSRRSLTFPISGTSTYHVLPRLPRRTFPGGSTVVVQLTAPGYKGLIRRIVVTKSGANVGGDTRPLTKATRAR